MTQEHPDVLPNSESYWQAMSEESFPIQVENGLAVTAIRTLPDSTAAKVVFLYAPGGRIQQ